jgi:ankyrin repeat protein
MALYQTLGVILILAVLGGITGLVLIVRGFRARYLDDHPLCKKCGYDLYPKPPASCPECGANLQLPVAIRIGHRTRHKPMMAWGLGLIVVCVAGYWLADKQRHAIRLTPAQLTNAIQAGDEARVDAILTRYPELADGRFLGESTYYNTALAQAVSIANPSPSHRRIIDRILREKPDVNRYPMDYGEKRFTEYGTALHRAVHAGDLQIVENLLQNGADPNLPGDTGRTPLHEITLHASNAIAIAKLLLKYGADPTLLDDWGMTPLHYLADNGDTWQMTPVLLQAGVDPNTPDKYGYPPIHYAIELSIASNPVHDLLKNGADPTITNHKGHLPGTFNPRSSNQNDNTEFWWRLLTDGYELQDAPDALPFLSSPEAILERAPGILAFTVRTPNYTERSLFELAIMHNRPDLLDLFLKHADANNADVQNNARRAHTLANKNEKYAWARPTIETWLSENASPTNEN